MDQKQKYCIHNWSHYNTSLKNRDNLNIWIDEKVIQGCYAERLKNKTGRPFTYSDDAIKTALLLKNVFNFPLRAAEGFIIQIFQLMKINLPVPSYTQLCRRAKRLKSY